MDTSELEQSIGYTFQKKDLLEEALTHPSKGYESRKKMKDNQRMEFLGDSVLQLVMTQYLYEHFTECEEGFLTKLRARVVSREMLAEVGKDLGLGNYLIMGHGEATNEGRLRPSNLADAVEAVIAAVYLDSGFAPTQKWVVRLFDPYLQRVLKQPVEKNPKGVLQEWFQQHGQGAPTYEVVEESGPDHDRMFTVRVLINEQELAQGKGKSKKSAEMEAAQQALLTLEQTQGKPA